MELGKQQKAIQLDNSPSLQRVTILQILLVQIIESDNKQGNSRHISGGKEKEREEALMPCQMLLQDNQQRTAVHSESSEKLFSTRFVLLLLLLQLVEC